MCEYGFIEGEDFCSKVSESTGGRPSTDHQLTISMAKELCMIQRTELGRRFRQYFIQIEEQWNSPEMVMKRALEIANRRVNELTLTVSVQAQQINELQPKASYYDVVLNCKDLLSIGKIAKDFGKSAVWLNKWLHEKGVQYKQGDIWLLYQKYAEMGYTSTKTQTFAGDDGETHSKVHTYWTQKGRLFIYSMLKADGVLPLVEQDKSA
jgi:anti-repressor protein